MQQQTIFPMSFLPGQLPPSDCDKKFNKSQAFTVIQQSMCENIPYNDVLKPCHKMTCDSLSESLNKYKQLDESLKKAINLRKQKELPFEANIVKENLITSKDPRVLRFYAFFTEAVHISCIETEVRRNVTIFFYLSDQTLQITEPKIKNSGIPQGDFLTRQKVLSEQTGNVDYFCPNDFRIGKTIKIFTREFFIYDADRFTRDYYLSKSVVLNDAFPLKPDQFTANKLKTDRQHLAEIRKQEKVERNKTENREISHHKLNQYLKFDKKVLCFNLIWKDDSYFGVVNKYRLYYHLSDDTIEVQEEVQNGSMNALYPMFVKRGRLPKLVSISHYPGMHSGQIEYYHYKDLLIPNKINIYGRECILVSCDEFSKDFYRKELSIEQVDCEEKNDLKQDQKKERIIPPYNGYGSEEDSLMNCFSIQPKPPKIDLNHKIKYRDLVLRFVCRTIGSDINNSSKKFNLSFYLENNSIMIYMLADKNSGISPGKFLERGVYLNPVTNSHFTINDFEIGKILEINKFSYQILSMDEFTLKYLIDKNSGNLQEKIAVLIENMKKRYSIDSTLNLSDEEKNQWFDFEHFTEVLKKCFPDLTLNEVFLLFYCCDRNIQGEAYFGDVISLF